MPLFSSFLPAGTRSADSMSLDTIDFAATLAGSLLVAKTSRSTVVSKKMVSAVFEDETVLFKLLGENVFRVSR